MNRAAALLLVIGLATPLPAYADTCRAYGEGRPNDDGWPQDLYRFAESLDRATVDTAAFKRAAVGFTQQIASFDPIKPGSVLEALIAIADQDAMLTTFRECAADGKARTGEPLLAPTQIETWSKMLQANAEGFLRVFGDKYEVQAFGPGRYAQTNRQRVAASPSVRAALRRTRPALLTRIDADVDTRLHGTAEGQFIAQVRTQNERTLTRAAALRSMPQTVGGWRRFGDFSYVRPAAAGITLTLSCGGELGRGLILSLARRGGDFVHGPGSEIIASDMTKVRIDVDGARIDAVAPLFMVRQSESTSDDPIQNRKTITTTTYYDPTRTSLSFQSGEGLALEVRKNLHGTIAAAKSFAASIYTPRTFDPNETQLVDVFAEYYLTATDIGLPLAAWNVDIDRVRRARSARLSVMVQSPSGATEWVAMGNLQPAGPPFSTLMAACHGM